LAIDYKICAPSHRRKSGRTALGFIRLPVDQDNVPALGAQSGDDVILRLLRIVSLRPVNIRRNAMIRIFKGQALHPDREGRFPEQDYVIRGVRYGVIDMVAIHIYYGLLSQLPENRVSLNALKPSAYLYPNALQLSTSLLGKSH
jgi:hypothetical protein